MRGRRLAQLFVLLSAPAAPQPLPDFMSTLLAGGGVAGSSGGAAKDGAGSNAYFNSPSRAVQLPSGELLVTDTANHALRVVSRAGVVTTASTSPIALNQPSGLTLLASGDVVMTVTATHGLLLRNAATGAWSILSGAQSANGLQQGVDMGHQIS